MMAATRSAFAGTAKQSSSVRWGHMRVFDGVDLLIGSDMIGGNVWVCLFTCSKQISSVADIDQHGTGIHLARVRLSPRLKPQHGFFQTRHGLLGRLSVVDIRQGDDVAIQGRAELFDRDDLWEL